MTKRKIFTKQGGAGHVSLAPLHCRRLVDESGHFRVQVNNRRDCFGRRLNETGEF